MMMNLKTVISAINARFVHSSLSLLYLKSFCGEDYDITLKEFSVNNSVRCIYDELLSENAVVYAFSCYIWNVEITLKVAEMLKSAKPDCRIVLGGPEVSYDAEDFLSRSGFIDNIILGEGEIPFKKLLDTLRCGEEPEKVLRCESPLDLSSVKLPYTAESLSDRKNKIIYFETSRGCPFCCAYCLSCVQGGVRYFPLDYVFSGLHLFFDRDIPLVKLIDRTFNSDPERACEIIEFIIKNSRGTRVHLELAPHLLTDRITELLGNAPKDIFQLEMGIQSTNPQTLKAVNRYIDLGKAERNIRKLREYNNLHIHLDLIAGLPYEDWDSIKESFNFVYSLKPHMLQLGFLKVLRGSNTDTAVLKHQHFAPYEVISTNWLSAEEIHKLHKIETAVERLYNSGAFERTMALETTDDPFDTFEKLSHLIDESTSRTMLYEILYRYAGDDAIMPLISDFMLNNRGAVLPSFAKKSEIKNFKKRIYEFLNGADINNTRFECVFGKVLYANYVERTVTDVTGFFTAP